MGFVVSFRPAWAAVGPCCGGMGRVLVTDLEESPETNQKRSGKYEGIGAADTASLQGVVRTTSPLRLPTQARFMRMQARARPIPGPVLPLRKLQSLSNAFSSRERDHGKLSSDQRLTFWWLCHCKVSEGQDK